MLGEQEDHSAPYIDDTGYYRRLVRRYAEKSWCLMKSTTNHHPKSLNGLKKCVLTLMFSVIVCVMYVAYIFLSLVICLCYKLIHHVVV